jgi:hypothetical protein
MRLLALLFLLLFFSPAAADEWSIGPAPGDAPGSRAAWVQNGDGHLLILRSLHDNDAYWVVVELRLTAGAAFGGVLPTSQIDDGNAVGNDWQLGHEQYGRTWGHIDGGSASWTLAVNTHNVIPAGDVLHRWVTGKEVVITYQTVDGASRSSSFTLVGMRNALLTVTGAKVED